MLRNQYWSYKGVRIRTRSTFLTGYFHSIVGLNEIVVFVPKYSRDWIAVDGTTDADVATFRKLSLTYRHADVHRYCVETKTISVDDVDRES